MSKVPYHIWLWRDAPEELRQHSTKGGDEDLVVWITDPDYDVGYLMHHLKRWDYHEDEIRLDDGSLLYIFAH